MTTKKQRPEVDVDGLDAALAAQTPTPTPAPTPAPTDQQAVYLYTPAMVAIAAGVEMPELKAQIDAGRIEIASFHSVVGYCIGKRLQAERDKMRESQAAADRLDQAGIEKWLGTGIIVKDRTIRLDLIFALPVTKAGAFREMVQAWEDKLIAENYVKQMWKNTAGIPIEGWSLDRIKRDAKKASDAARQAAEVAQKEALAKAQVAQAAALAGAR